MTKGVAVLKWAPIYLAELRPGATHPERETVVGWKIDGQYSTVKIVESDELTWTGRCDALFDTPLVLASATEASAKREFLKMCLRKARALTSELEGVWTRTEETHAR